MEDQQKKIDDQRDIIDDKNSEIQRLNDRMELLDQADVKNFEQHKQILERQDNMMTLIQPMSETFQTIRILGKWVGAIVVFLGVLGGAIWSFISILKEVKHQ